ncbi:MAG: GTPase domain-containing protein [Bdellovibrionales bacterium]|nr:GTPase domain-containing protein [Bdellovibrionales bacterium]
MPIINTDAREIHCKIVYYGPKSSGKSSSLQFLHDRSSMGKLTRIPISLSEKDYQPIHLYLLNLGKVLGHRFSFQILNAPRNSQEEDFYLLKGADGIVFVADSRVEAEEQNKKDLEELKDILIEQGRDIFRVPLALQYNKRDLDNVMDSYLMRADLNKYNNRDFESSVSQGAGIMAPFKHICRLALTSLKSGEFL